MKKHELETGMVVLLANDRKAVLYISSVIDGGGMMLYEDGESQDSIYILDDDLNYVGSQKDIGVISVYKCPRYIQGHFFRTSNLSKLIEASTFLIWQKPEEMTVEQVCKELGREIKIVKG